MTNAAKQRVMIIGTEGNPDYMVIAQDQGFILGIKPLLLIGMDGAQYGFRLRLQKDVDSKTDIENTHADLDTMQAVFTGIPWSKRSSTRFSTVLLNEVSYGVEFIDKIKTEVFNGFSTLFDEIVETIAPVTLNDETDTLKFITERFELMLTEVAGAYAQYKGEGKQAEQNGDVADVIAFPKGEDPDDVA
jgi:hypothetical protein